MTPTAGSLEKDFPLPCNWNVKKKILVELKGSHGIMRQSRNEEQREDAILPQEPREAVVLVGARSWGHQAESGTLRDYGESCYSRGSNSMMKVEFTADIQSTLRDSC